MNLHHLALVDQIRRLPPDDAAALLAQLGTLELVELSPLWRAFWARPDQIAPKGKWKHWLLVGGRGSGKSHSLSHWVIERARGGFGPIRLIAGTLGDVRITMVEGESGILACSPPDFMPKWDPSADDGAGLLTWPNGVTARGFSAERPRRLRGKQSRTDAYDDLAGMGNRAKDVFDMAQFGLRVWGDTRAAYTTTPEDSAVVVYLLEGEVQNMVTTRSETDDNIGNLTPDIISTLEGMYGGTELEDQERRGILIRKSRNSPFHGLDFAGAPIRLASCDPHSFEEIAIGVDPAEGSGEDHDEWGIVVGARRHDRHIITLEDLSDPLDADDACARIMEAAARWGRMCPQARIVVVAEMNRGDLKTRSALESAYYKRRAAALEGASAVELEERDGVWVLPEVIGVRAKEGKVIRGGDVRPLFVSGMAHHVGGLYRLEAQAFALRPGAPKRKRTDDRIDAEVHMLHHLAGLGAGKGLPGPWAPSSAPAIEGRYAAVDPRRQTRWESRRSR